MESNSIIVVKYDDGELDILKNSINKFKRIYNIDFKVIVDECQKKFIMDLGNISPNNAFLAGYYYGALQYIYKKTRVTIALAP